MGEGGGQILRSALALSLHLQRPIHLINIRAQRRPPGLRRQHLTCLLAAAELSGATLEGAQIGSQEIHFTPGPLRPGRYTFDIGTAGSTTLLLQAILPPLLLASGPSHLTLHGGTHNPQAPPFDFLGQVLLPQLQRMGARVRLHLQRPGFYPRGGGILAAEIEPVSRLHPLELTERGEIQEIAAQAVVAGLPRHIAERELKVLAERLDPPPARSEIVELSECGIGNIVTATVRCRHVTELFCGFGERGVRAEKIAGALAGEVRNYLDAQVPVGPHLADQLLVPLALAGGGRFITLPPTRHTTTTIRVIEAFLPWKFSLEQQSPTHWQVGLPHQ